MRNSSSSRSIFQLLVLSFCLLFLCTIANGKVLSSLSNNTLSNDSGNNKIQVIRQDEIEKTDDGIIGREKRKENQEKMNNDNDIRDESIRVKILAWITRVPASLSIIGSTLIIVAVLFKEGAVNETYHRMMLILSFYDLLGALWLLLGSIPVLEEYGIPGSYGNTAVCSAQGFFIHFSVIATNIYNSALVVYFVFKVRYNTSDRIIQRFFEPCTHVLAFCISLATATTGQVFQVFNPIGFGGPSNSPLCYIQAFPPGCDWNDEMECTRGENAGILIWYIAIVPFFLATGILLFSLAIVLWTVFTTNKRNLRYTRGCDRKKKMKQTRIVAKRCILYGIIFFNTFIWTSVSMIIHNKEPPKFDSFWIGCMAFLFMPLQGFLNFLVYISPRIKKVKKANPTKSKASIFIKSIATSGV